VDGIGVAVGIIVGDGVAVGIIVGTDDTSSCTTTTLLGVSVGAAMAGVGVGTADD